MPIVVEVFSNEPQLDDTTVFINDTYPELLTDPTKKVPSSEQPKLRW